MISLAQNKTERRGECLMRIWALSSSPHINTCRICYDQQFTLMLELLSCSYYDCNKVAPFINVLPSPSQFKSAVLLTARSIPPIRHTAVFQSCLRVRE